MIKLDNTYEPTKEDVQEMHDTLPKDLFEFWIKDLNIPQALLEGLEGLDSGR